MAEKLVVSKNGAILLPLTPEEEAQRVLDAENAAAKRLAREAEKARLSEIKASEFVAQIEDALRGKTLTQIGTYLNNNLTGLDPAVARIIKGLVFKWALEIR